MARVLGVRAVVGLCLVAACSGPGRNTYLGEARRARMKSEEVLAMLSEESAAAYRAASSTRPERVAEQAAADFPCPIEELQVEPVYVMRTVLFGASGCDMTGLYAASSDLVYAVGPRSSVRQRQVAALEEWHPGGGITDPGPSDPRLRCPSPSVRVCAAERFVCSAESIVLADLGKGRWQAHGCGQHAVWMPTARGWALDQ